MYDIRYWFSKLATKIRIWWRERLKGTKYLLEIPTLDAGEYYDYDHIMAHACFQLLTLHIDNEYGGIKKFEERVKILLNHVLNPSYDWMKEMDWQAYRWDRTKLRLYKWWHDVYLPSQAIHSKKDLHETLRIENQIFRRMKALSIVYGSMWT